MHKMNLWNDSFEAIKDGWKTIEMRLNDEKRSIIKIGDEIEFTNVKTNELLICKVTNLFMYKNFDELYNNHNKISIGYKENEIANPNDMLMYYSKEDIEKYGVLGIELIKIGGSRLQLVANDLNILANVLYQNCNLCHLNTQGLLRN